MMRPGFRTCVGCLASLAALVCSGPLLAFVEPDKKAGPLAAKEFVRPELRITSSNVALPEALSRLSNADPWGRFVADQGSDVQVHIDPRSGTPSSIILHTPIVPGTGASNHLTLDDLGKSLGQSVARIDDGIVAWAVRRFVDANLGVLGIDAAQLGEPRSARASEDLWQVSFPQQVDGVPVRYGRLLATINHGNLVLLGTETWGNARVDTKPAITADEAVRIGAAYWGKQGSDTVWRAPALDIIPIAPARYQVGEEFAGPIGSGYEHRLVWSYGIVRPGDPGSYEVLVDAHTGELLSFEDLNHYIAEQITGGVYPLTNTGICPSAERCGIMQPGYPMPFADTGFSAPNDFTNSGGVYQYSSGTLTTTLSGQFVKIVDTCGAVSESSASGSLNLGGVNGDHDCTSGGASPGDTPASRTAYNEVNKLKEVARGWLPANPWLQAQLRTNVNLNATCNAFYSPGTGQINFYKSGGGCRNTGEIAAVFDHEWGHGLDDNDSIGNMSNSSETYADIAAILRLQNSCAGYGFYQSNDKGCGMTADGTGFNANNAQMGTPNCELDCSGVRGMDWDKHASHTPDTPANFVCPRCFGGGGPCGREVHCDNHPAAESGWDLAARDLRAAPYNLDAQTAFIVASKIFYQGSGSIGTWWTCTCPTTSDGCGAANAYLQWLAADDDNGNLNDGTPHMTALYNAFNRHAIACPSPTVQDSGCAGAPTAAPVVMLSIGNNAITLNWTAVAGASQYWVMRSEGYFGCNIGKARIAVVSGTTYTDTQIANGSPYNYMVIAQGATEACYGPGSACVTATPQTCAGAISFDRLSYNCHDSMNIALVDSDHVGDGTQNVEIFSGTEPVHETRMLTETPSGSGIFRGTFGTTSAPPATGDGAVTVADGDTITVRYLDTSFCGAPNVTVDKAVPVDCALPLISNVQATNVTGASARVTWNTNEPADSTVLYGTAPPPTAGMATSAAFATSHEVTLTGLSECTPYLFDVKSTDTSGNTATETNGSSHYTFTTSKHVNPTVPYTGVPVGIPDNTPTGASATIHVTSNKTVQDVNVTIGSLTHTWDGDLIVHLVHGTTDLILSAQRGSDGDNYTNTVFDDQATVKIADGTAPFTGAFKPDAPLSIFNGQAAGGDWSLYVVDAGPNDLGVINSWSLTFVYPQECGASARYASSTAQDQCAGSGGNGNIDPGDDVVLPLVAYNNGSDPLTHVVGTLSTSIPGVTITQGTATFPDLPVDANGASGVPFRFTVDSSVPCGTMLGFDAAFETDQGTFGSSFALPTGAPTSRTDAQGSTDVPKTILDYTTVTSNVPVSGLGTVLDVNVGVGSLTHTADIDLVLTLIGPNGTRVKLSERRGGNADNYTGTLFDDEAANPVSIGKAPFTGPYKPEEPLSALDGISANGTWALEVADVDINDTGSLNSWTLTLKTTVPPSCESCSQPVPGEVFGLVWSPGTKDSLQWNAAADATFYQLYRGDAVDLPHLLDGSVDSCTRATQTGTSTGSTLNAIGDGVGAGGLHWYLVRGGNGTGFGPPGDATAGPRIQDSSGSCP